MNNSCFNCPINQSAEKDDQKKVIENMDELEAVDLLKVLLDKQPFQFVSFVCLALYGLSMLFYFDRYKRMFNQISWSGPPQGKTGTASGEVEEPVVKDDKEKNQIENTTNSAQQWSMPQVFKSSPQPNGATPRPAEVETTFKTLQASIEFESENADCHQEPIENQQTQSSSFVSQPETCTEPLTANQRKKLKKKQKKTANCVKKTLQSESETSTKKFSSPLSFDLMAPSPMIYPSYSSLSDIENEKSMKIASNHTRKLNKHNVKKKRQDAKKKKKKLRNNRMSHGEDRDRDSDANADEPTREDSGQESSTTEDYRWSPPKKLGFSRIQVASQQTGIRCKSMQRVSQDQFLNDMNDKRHSRYTPEAIEKSLNHMIELAASHSPKESDIYAEFKKIMVLENDYTQNIGTHGSGGVSIVNLELKVAARDEDNLQKYLAEWFLHIKISKNDFRDLGISHKRPQKVIFYITTVADSPVRYIPFQLMMGQVSTEESLKGQNLVALSLNDDAIKVQIFNLKNQKLVGKRLEKQFSISEDEQKFGKLVPYTETLDICTNLQKSKSVQQYEHIANVDDREIMNYLTDHVDFVQSMSSEDDPYSPYKIYKLHKTQKNYIQHFNLQKKGTQRLNRFKESIGLVKPCRRSIDPDETRLFSGFKCDFRCAFTAQYNQFKTITEYQLDFDDPIKQKQSNDYDEFQIPQN